MSKRLKDEIPTLQCDNHTPFMLSLKFDFVHDAEKLSINFHNKSTLSQQEL